jgi:hypothetical protein
VSGYVNEKGEEVVPPGRFDAVGDFSANGLAAFAIKSGQRAEVRDFAPDDPFPSLEERLVRGARDALRKLDSGWVFKAGYLNEKGEEVIPPCFDGVGHFTANGLARVGIRDEYGIIRYSYINARGEEAFARFRDAKNAAADGSARVETDGGRICMASNPE